MVARVAVSVVLLVAALAPYGARAIAARVLPRGGPRLVITHRVHTGSQPKSVAVSPDGRQVWVAAFGQRDHDNVEVYDAATLALWGRVSIPGNPVETLFTADGRTAYVSSFAHASVEEVDVGTRTVRASIPAGLDPKMLALSHDGARLYVVNWRSNDVYVIDVRSRARLQVLETARHPRGIVVLRDDTVLVASTEGDVVHVFDRDGRATRRIDVCDFPRHLALSPDERTLYVTCSGTSLMTAYALASAQPVFSARTGGNPRSLAATRDGRFLASADFGGSGITLVDVVGQTARRTRVEDATQIVGVAFSPSASLRVFATSWRSRELVAFERAP